MKTKLIVPYVIILILANFQRAYGYDDKIAHPRISEIAVQKSTLKTFLPKYLGVDFVRGYDSSINGASVLNWIRRGSIAEDAEMCRRSNHMHNPLKTWDISYMNDVWWTDGCLAIWGKEYSNITWATSFLGPPPEGRKAIFTSMPRTAPYNWDRARHFYYLALTTNTPFYGERQDYYSNAFKTLGHIMHLLQDMAVPAHARNDFASHLIGTGIIWGKGRYQPYEYYVQSNADLISGTDLVKPSYADLKLTSYWDADKYNGSNPSRLTDIGLAEFSNANYFSDYTISSNNPTPEHSFPYPYIGSSNASGPSYQICEDYALGSGIRMKYVSRKENGACSQTYMSGTNDHFAVATLLNHESIITDDNIAILRLWLDENVHRTYAKELLPRAVGYSVALLDYFFRGTIVISLPPSAIYAFSGDRYAGFSKLKILAENTTENNEQMTDGSIELVVRYRTVQEDPFQPLDLQASSYYTYKVIPEATGRRTIPRGAPVELIFGDGSNMIIPMNAVDISLQVVYHGWLGNEEGAVAVGFREISDTTPVELMNNMDKVCLNGSWYDAGSPAAIAQVDSNNNGVPEWDIYPHNLKDAYVKVSPVANQIDASPTQFTYSVGSIGAGYLSRAYILSEATSGINHSYYTTVLKTTAADTFTHASDVFSGIREGYTIKSQITASEDAAVCNAYGLSKPCTIRHAPPFYRFRGTYLWGATGVILDNPEYPVGNKCSWKLLP